MKPSSWVQTNMRYSDPSFTLTEEQVRLVDVLCSIAPPYRCMGVDWRQAEWSPNSLTVWTDGPQGLSTYDSDDLTRLVLAAHEEAVRVDVSPDHSWHWRELDEWGQATTASVYRFIRRHLFPFACEYLSGVEDSRDWIREQVEIFRDGDHCGRPCLRIHLSIRSHTATHQFGFHPDRSALAPVEVTS